MANTPTGAAADGEVEDYRIEIKAPDFGDAPRSYGAPSHFIPASIQHVIGTPNIDGELGPLYDVYASGDDTNNRDDEDGVTLKFYSAISTRRLRLSTLSRSDFGNLCGWLDGGNGGALDGVFQPAKGSAWM